MGELRQIYPFGIALALVGPCTYARVREIATPVLG